MNKVELAGTPSEPSEGVRKSNTKTLLGVQSTLTLTFNIILWLTILLVYELRRKTRSQFFLNLLLIHILFAVINFYKRESPSLNFTYCKDGLIIVMVLAVLMNTRDCYQGIKNPIKHETMTTKDVITIIAVSIWTPPLLFVCLAMFSEMSWYLWTSISGVVLIVGVFALSISNVCVYFIARNDTEGTKINRSPIASNIKKENKLKSAYLSFSICFSLVMLLLPNLIYTFLLLRHNTSRDEHVSRVTYQLIFLNSLLHPVLFICFSRDVRLVTKKIRRMLHYDKRELDRKKSRHLLMRSRFSGSI